MSEYLIRLEPLLVATTDHFMSNAVKENLIKCVFVQRGAGRDAVEH